MVAGKCLVVHFVGENCVPVGIHHLFNRDHAGVGHAGFIGISPDEVCDLAVGILVAKSDGVDVHATFTENVTDLHTSPFCVSNCSIPPVRGNEKWSVLGDIIFLPVAGTLQRTDDSVFWELLEVRKGEGLGLDTGSLILLNFQNIIFLFDVRDSIVISDEEDIVGSQEAVNKVLEVLGLRIPGMLRRNTKLTSLGRGPHGIVHIHRSEFRLPLNSIVVIGGKVSDAVFFKKSTNVGAVVQLIDTPELGQILPLGLGLGLYGMNLKGLALQAPSGDGRRQNAEGGIFSMT